MRIIFVFDNIYPNGWASSSRVRAYGEGFRALDIDVIVLLPQPRIPYNQENINPQKCGEDKNGVKYYYMAGGAKRKRNFVIRQLVDIWGIVHTMCYLLLHIKKDDYIVLYEGKNFWYKMITFISHLRGCKVGMELNELPFGTRIETPFLLKKRKRMLKNIFPNLDFFLCISKPLAALAHQHSPNAKIIEVPILCEKYDEQNLFSESPENVPYIFHSGTLTEQKDGICGMMRAFGMACQQINEPIKFILTGDLQKSPYAQEIKDIIKYYGISDRVVFIGFLDSLTLKRYQKHCFAVIINKYNTLQNKYCFSTKLGEYLQCARPVITTTIGESNRYLEDNVNAFVVPPGKPAIMAEKIVYIYFHPQEAEKVGKNGLMLSQKEFNSKIHAVNICKNLENI